ncbi:MAG: PA2928 family protein [Bryobacter sp.]|nr:PA2928 family protein [Bryobacter sp.]
MKPRSLLVALAVLLAAGVIAAIVLIPNFTLTPAASFGPPVRAGNRIYLLTGQWKSRWFSSGRSARSSDRSTDLLVDLWAFDATTLQPIFRRRLQTVPDGAMYGRAILGVQNQTVWLLLPGGLHAASAQDGRLVATPETIEEKNPNLRGLLSTESRFYRFTAQQGLIIIAADAATWYLHPDHWQAAKQPFALGAGGHSYAPAYFTPNSTLSFKGRGYPLGAKWLGVLTEAESKVFNREYGIPGLDDFTPRAVYAGDISQEKTFFGDQARYGNFKQLTQLFLAAGVLVLPQPSGPGALVYRQGPDSIFVLHKSRIDEEAVLQLARVTGPEGKLLWNIALPLSVLQSVLPGEESLVLYGRLFTKADPTNPGPRDPFHTAREMLVAVDWKSGAIREHDQSNIKSHPDAR